MPDPYENLDAADNGRWTKTLTAGEVANKLRAAGYSIGTVSNVAITKRTAMDNVNEVTVTDTKGSKVVLKRQACRTVFGVNSIRYSINGQSGGSGAPVKTDTTVLTPAPPAAPETAPLPSANPLDTVEPTNYISGSSAAGPYPRFAAAVIGATGDALRQYLKAYGATSSFTFAGTGWGHNVGMSQYGAKGMAELGFGYQEILHYYFTDVQIQK